MFYRKQSLGAPDLRMGCLSILGIRTDLLCLELSTTNLHNLLVKSAKTKISDKNIYSFQNHTQAVFTWHWTNFRLTEKFEQALRSYGTVQ